MPEISLIICTRNRDDMISETLDAVINQSVDPSLYEVIVVDQSTNDKTQELVKNYPSFKYIKLDSKGISISRNEGLKHSQGNIIVFIDDDIIFGNDYLANILDFFKNSELTPDVIGGKIHFKYLSQKPDWLEWPLLGILGYSDFGNKPALYDSHPKHVPFTGSIAIKRQCLDKAGGFSGLNTSIGTGLISNEDVIFTNKLRNMGYKLVYCPDMLVSHKIQPGHMTYDYYRKRYFAQGRSDAYTYLFLGMYPGKDIWKEFIRHSGWLLQSLPLRYLKKNLTEKYYQKLRLYYNSGYLLSLIDLFINRDKFNENSRISG